MRRALADTLAAGTARVEGPDGLHGAINFRIPAERLFYPDSRAESPLAGGRVIPTDTETVVYRHSQYLRTVARDAAQQRPLSSKDQFPSTRWSSQRVNDTAVRFLQVEVGGRGTYRFSGHQTFRGETVSVYTISRPTMTY